MLNPRGVFLAHKQFFWPERRKIEKKWRVKKKNRPNLEAEESEENRNIWNFLEKFISISGGQKLTLYTMQAFEK